MTDKHICDEWEEHESVKFNMHTEVYQDGSLYVFDQFTGVTPKEYQKPYTVMYEIKGTFCMFCGVKLVE